MFFCKYYIVDLINENGMRVALKNDLMLLFNIQNSKSKASVIFNAPVCIIRLPSNHQSNLKSNLRFVVFKNRENM